MKLKKKLSKFFFCQFVLTFQIMNWVNKLEASHLEKPQSPILKKSNVSGWNWKIKLYKKIQNTTIKKIRAKLEIKKKYMRGHHGFWNWRGKLKRKIKIIKESKKKSK